MGRDSGSRRGLSHQVNAAWLLRAARRRTVPCTGSCKCIFHRRCPYACAASASASSMLNWFGPLLPCRGFVLRVAERRRQFLRLQSILPPPSSLSHSAAAAGPSTPASAPAGWEAVGPEAVAGGGSFYGMLCALQESCRWGGAACRACCDWGAPLTRSNSS